MSLRTGCAAMLVGLLTVGLALAIERSSEPASAWAAVIVVLAQAGSAEWR